MYSNALSREKKEKNPMAKRTNKNGLPGMQNSPLQVHSLYCRSARWEGSNRTGQSKSLQILVTIQNMSVFSSGRQIQNGLVLPDRKGNQAEFTSLTFSRKF